jgi:hypothetical protein
VQSYTSSISNQSARPPISIQYMLIIILMLPEVLTDENEWFLAFHSTGHCPSLPHVATAKTSQYAGLSSASHFRRHCNRLLSHEQIHAHTPIKSKPRSSLSRPRSFCSCGILSSAGQLHFNGCTSTGGQRRRRTNCSAAVPSLPYLDITWWLQ